ncbi:urate hydroxylase PuuD [Dongia rigui]|uniref:Urate hydroxylase PuuD n=1 Tax=Dongia rigui TaxID=940149 RepID=A0ABU5DUT4_9PROT|nr:urate hydroxylase PuuD [Dongia rigui]MDY0871065.1 urate hydroxylase PuuD [Dongia rigui]
MDPILAEWLSLAIRWVHVMTGIMWIGTSFFFIWLDASLRHYQTPKPGIAGESWLVHGGGFYAVEKFLVAPGTMPAELHWFKYEAYFTWLSGFLLLALIYYYGAEQNLIDPSVSSLTGSQAILVSLALLAGGWVIYDLLCRSPIGRHTGALACGVFLLVALAAYVATQAFSGRAAYLHVGAFIGTIMAANVFMIIIPNQRKVVKALLAGEAPDPALGKQAKQRSLHNNYLTLPVVLMMISNHYPIMYESPYRWLFVMGAVILSGLLRAYANARNAGTPSRKVDHLLVVAAGLGLCLAVLPALQGQSGVAVARRVDLTEAAAIIQQRCLACHSTTPTDAFFKAPPKGIAFDSAAEIRRYAPMIERVAVATKMMPLRNKTGMTDEERALLGAWITGAADHGGGQ